MGSEMHFAESPETVPHNLREVQPTAFLAVPRVWEKFYSGVTIALKDATPLQNWMYRQALGLGYQLTEYKLQGDTAPLPLRLANQAAYWLVFRNIRRMLGLDRCRLAFTGAAPIAPDLIRWYLALGIDMREVYGQTENCGVATVMPPDRIKLGSVGKAAPWGEVKVSPEGEILIKGDFLFMGYLNQPEKTAETIDPDGWLHTGDVGYVDTDGYLVITDRIKDLIITSTGFASRGTTRRNSAHTTRGSNGPATLSQARCAFVNSLGSNGPSSWSMIFSAIATILVSAFTSGMLPKNSAGSRTSVLERMV